MSEETPTQADAASDADDAAEDAAPAAEPLRPDQLYAFVWALAKDPPSLDEDREVRQLINRLPEHFQETLPTEFRLGPETFARLRELIKEENPSRQLLIEDGADAPRPKTDSEVERQAQREEDQRKRKVWRFGASITIGIVGFFASQFLFHLYRVAHQTADTEGEALTRVKGFELDWRIYSGMLSILVAAWFIADAYAIARELWIDWTKFKAAVPVIGRKWVEKSKAKLGE